MHSSDTDEEEPDMSAEDKQRLEALFNKLDINKDGELDMEDLTKALGDLGVPQVPDHAKNFFKNYDKNDDGKINFHEFLKYVTEREKVLRIHFKKIDTNEDGMLDAQEIKESFEKMGIKIDLEEAERLLQRMDKDGTLKVEWDEWKDYLLLTPAGSLTDILHYWRHATIFDIGENGMVPDDFTEQELKTGLWWRHLVAGGAAGAVSRTCTAPLDRLKIILQVKASKEKQITIKSGFQHMLREGGVKSLWRGNFMNVVKIAPESALKFMAYEQIKTLFNKKELGFMERTMSGSAAGAISQTIIYPMEVLKTRMALRKTGQYRGIGDCAIQLYQKEGLKVFYRGYVPNLLGILPYAGIDLAVYETMKKVYVKKNKKDPNIPVLLGFGALSSTCGQLTSYPLALVRTRLQAQGVGKKSTMSQMFQQILKEDGFRGLYRGIAPNFLKVIPAVSISYVVYEKSRKLLGC